MAKYTFDQAFETLFITVCQKSNSVAKAAVALKMNYKTISFHAKWLNCFKPNQSGKNLVKKPSKNATPLEEIFTGKFLTYQTHKLKLRLLSEGYKKHLCESCGLSKWIGKPIALELHHVDGDRSNNSLQNLNLLCPNCHAQTSNYRAKNIRNLSTRLETAGVKPLKFGEASTAKQIVAGNPEPSPDSIRKGVET